MRFSLPRASIIAFTITFLSAIIYWIISSLQILLGQSFTDALQTLDGVIGIASFMLGVVLAVNNYFNELPLPPTIRDFHQIFPKKDTDSPEFLRDFPPHRVDFEEDFVVLPKKIGILILKKIKVRAGNLFGAKIEKEDADRKIATALVSGFSGSGKSTTTLRFCFELLAFGWRVFYSDASELFQRSDISEIRDWFCSLRKRNLIVIDNIHDARKQVNTLLDTIEDSYERGLLRVGTKIRILCIETRPHTVESHRSDRNVERIAGKRIATLPFTTDEKVGLALTKTKTPRPPGDLIGKVPALIIERGTDIAKLLFHRFQEVVTIKSTLDFDTIFSETGSVVEFCEVLRWAKENSDSISDELISESFSRVAEITLERRLKVVSNRELGILALGLISSFSQVGTIVSVDFLDSCVDKEISNTVSELITSQHLFEIFVGPGQKQFVMCTHAELAKLLRIACTPVLQDLLESDDDSETDIRLYTKYLEYINSLPPKASIGIGSSFILILSSHASIYQLKYLADFVIEIVTSWENPDINIKYSMYNAGQFYFKSGLFEEAENIFEMVLSIDDQFIEARANLGALLLFRGELLKAIEHYEIAINQKPDDASLYGNLSQIYWEKGETDIALEKMQKAIDLAENVGRYWFNMGKMLDSLKRIDEGLPYLRKAIELSPEDVEFFVGISHVLIEVNRIDEAEEVINTAVSRNLESPSLLNNKGIILKKRGDLEGAKEFFEKSLVLDPNFSLALANLGEYYFTKNNLDLAEKKVCQALKQETGEAKIYVLYGQILNRLNRYSEVIDAFQKSISLGFEAPEIQANLVGAYYEVGELEKSDESMNRYRELSDDPNPISIQLAHYYISKLDFVRTKKCLILVAESSDGISPDYLSALSKLADASLRNRNLPIAEWALEILTTTNPELFAIWNSLGVVKAELGKGAEAKDALLKAIEIDPNNPAIWHNLGNVLKKLGEVDESMKAYDKAKQLGSLPSKDEV